MRTKRINNTYHQIGEKPAREDVRGAVLSKLRGVEGVTGVEGDEVKEFNGVERREFGVRLCLKEPTIKEFQKVVVRIAR